MPCIISCNRIGRSYIHGANSCTLLLPSAGRNVDQFQHHMIFKRIELFPVMPCIISCIMPCIISFRLITSIQMLCIISCNLIGRSYIHGANSCTLLAPSHGRNVHQFPHRIILCGPCRGSKTQYLSPLQLSPGPEPVGRRVPYSLHRLIA